METKKDESDETRLIEGEPVEKMPGLKGVFRRLCGSLVPIVVLGGLGDALVSSHVVPILGGAFKYARGNPEVKDLNRLACPLEEKSEWFPDNPDVTVLAGSKRLPFLHCEVKPTRSSRIRAAWDVVRLVRFGRCALSNSHQAAPLLQVVGRDATYMRLKEDEGLLVLEKVGTFKVPLVLDHLPELAKTCMVLHKTLEDIETAQGEKTRLQGLKNIVFTLGYLGSYKSAPENSPDNRTADDDADYE
ncbi:MAG: hypothetical protein J3Q66DRAFT_444649 [Benniella sp.]|nr:MAG: hypothetical protein J3Q66DRAFT_444649 [Benniella sp.]